MYAELLGKRKNMAVVGLGYVGLPIALTFARKLSVIGFDISEARLEKMRRGIDPSGELPASAFENADIRFSSSLDDLAQAAFYIVAVPTPVDQSNRPNLAPLLAATRSVAKVLKKGDYVVYESTVYPGCTEEDCLPILEEISGLRAGVDFKLGYSPERINPGDMQHRLDNTVKIVSGCDAEALDEIAEVYELAVDAGVHRASSIKVAEAAKIIENTQRDVNIALMNELSIIFSRMGINTYEVLEAAGTKWNFLNFSPGLVGGHCIGVDPYYLVHKAEALKYHPKIINAGRFINDSMGGYIGKKVLKQMISLGISMRDSRVLVMGVTFKEDVADIRNSKVVDIVKELEEFGVSVDVIDPYASADEVKKEYGLSLISVPRPFYDAVILAVAHQEYKGKDEAYFKALCQPKAVFADLKGLYRGCIHELNYWSL
ncbi:MAG: nucleotide sugar dehydrogenase [Bacteroidales bacterium]|nr:nucleotide sugar dehydrogenase [Bacteroidales bacterium]